MSDFKAKMHQIPFWLGLRPSPAGGAYSAPPDPLGGFKGAASRQGRGRGGKREGEGWGGTGRGGEEGRESKGRDGEGRGKVKDGMGATGQDMGRGKESERRKGEREKMGYSPKLQFLVPPLHIGGHSVPMGEKRGGGK